MPVIQGPTTVAGKDVSAWVVTDGKTDIAIGVTGKGAKIQYGLGGTAVYDVDPQNMTDNGTVVRKASQVRVANTGNLSISFEVFE